MANVNLNLVDAVEKQAKRIPSIECVLGLGSKMPCNSANSGPRKILYNQQEKHRLNLLNGQVAIIQTGTESQFGEYSSSFVRLEEDSIVVAKISKYQFDQTGDFHYFLILQNVKTGEYDVVERVMYNYNTESYGFLYDNTNLDKLRVGQYVKKGLPIKKSTAFDEFNNRKDGYNLNCTYMALEDNKEDGIVISDFAAEALSAPLIKKIKILLNENDIPLNLYGNDEVYKCMPDISQEVVNGLFMGVRKEKKSEYLYAQSVDKLKDLMMSDQKYTIEGQVVDINVYCNNKEILNSYNYGQIKYYYDQRTNFVNEFVRTVEQKVDTNNMSYELQRMYHELKKESENREFVEDNIFSNVELEVTVLYKNKLAKGDKMTNRYGGKGVVSNIVEVRPRCMMPVALIGNKLEYVDVIYNSSTCVNRENPGQLFEISETFIGQQIVNRILDPNDKHNLEDCIKWYTDYMDIVAPEFGHYMKMGFEDPKYGFDRKIKLLEEIKRDECIYVTQKPISECMTIDKLMTLYKEKFPWIQQCKVKVPQKDSNGNIRYVFARRRLVVGKQYFYRLKQYAEEKFSATSLSTTNIRNENSRNNSKRNHESNHSKTPVKFLGEMETNDLSHIGIENVIMSLMLLSSSPHGRRLAKSLLVDDPFKYNIVLDDVAKNRTVETLNTYLRTIGLKIIFEKVKKEKPKLFNRIYNKPRLFERLEDPEFDKPMLFRRIYNTELKPLLFERLKE